jgi:hypothetical protein
MKSNLLLASFVAVGFSSVALAATPVKVTVPASSRTSTKAVEATKPAPTNTTTSNAITPNSATTIYAQSPMAPASESAGAPMGNPFAGRTFSLTATFPGGGSQPIGNAFGGRMKLDADNWVGASLVISNNTDNKDDTTLFGLSGKLQHFFGSDKRARPYAAGSMYLWQPGGDVNEEAKTDDTAFGLSGAIGAEVFFIPEFSAFVETGLFFDTSNVDDTETEFGTFASAIGVNFNFDM